MVAHQGDRPALPWKRYRALPMEIAVPDSHGAEIVEEYEADTLRFDKSLATMQLDVFIPTMNIAFEYHGKQHYEDVASFGLSLVYKGAVQPLLVTSLLR